MISRFLLVAVSVFFGAAQAAEPVGSFPSRTVRLIVPYPAGGSNDILARLMAPKLSDLWRQSVIVENRAGASGAIGSEIVARAEGDGYTLLVGSNATITVSPHLRLKMPFDPLSDLLPLTNIATLPTVLALNPQIPAKTLSEFITLLKSNPGKYNFASSGPTSSYYLAAELFQLSTGTKMVHIPYTGVAPAALAVINGDAACFFNDGATSLPFVEDGRMRMLGVASLEPWPLAPKVPLIATEVPGFEASAFIGVFAPASTPAALATKLATDIRAVINDPPMKQRLRDLGAILSLSGISPEEYKAYIVADHKKWGGVVKSIGLQPN